MDPIHAWSVNDLCIALLDYDVCAPPPPVPIAAPAARPDTTPSSSPYIARTTRIPSPYTSNSPSSLNAESRWCTTTDTGCYIGYSFLFVVICAVVCFYGVLIFFRWREQQQQLNALQAAQETATHAGAGNTALAPVAISSVRDDRSGSTTTDL